MAKEIDYDWIAWLENFINNYDCKNYVYSILKFSILVINLWWSCGYRINCVNFNVGDIILSGGFMKLIRLIKRLNPWKKTIKLGFDQQYLENKNNGVQWYKADTYKVKEKL